MHKNNRTDEISSNANLHMRYFLAFYDWCANVFSVSEAPPHVVSARGQVIY